MEIERTPKKVVRIRAYYEENPTELEKEILDDIGTDILGIIDEIFDLDISILVSKDKYQSLESYTYLLYGRYEDFGDSYIE